jgi:DNA-binding PadR family transcriptional regulator
MNIRGTKLFRAVLNAADPDQTYSANQLLARAGPDMTPGSLYVTCRRLVEHGYLSATGKSQRRRYRRTPRGTTYLRVLEIDLPVRLCRALQRVSLEPRPLRDVVEATRQPHEALAQAYDHLHALAELNLVTVALQGSVRKTVCLTALGSMALPDAAFVMQFWEAS